MNAAVALSVVESIQKSGFAVSQKAIVDGLKDVRWPGRFELLRTSPDVIVDCAHNPASARALAQTMAQEYVSRRVILVLGVFSDKDVAGISLVLSAVAQHIILTKIEHPRAHQFSDMEAKKYFSGKTYTITPDIGAALKEALMSAKKEDAILVTGSVYTVAQAMEILGSTL
jgi:dihydrofolate synthase / folylpolyglutamate synthase